MPVGESGDVALAGRAYRVTVTEETARASRYAVECTDNAARQWKPGTVRVGVESRLACLTCRTHPERPCLHIEIARRYLAAQTVDRAALGPTALDRMLEALDRAAPVSPTTEERST